MSKKIKKGITMDLGEYHEDKFKDRDAMAEEIQEDIIRVIENQSGESGNYTDKGDWKFYPEDTHTNSDKLDALEKKMDENFKKIIDMLVDTKKELVDMLERLEIRN